MDILLATGRRNVPDDLSGSAQTNHALLQGLTERGHRCAALASLPPSARFAVATVAYRLSGGRVLLEWSDPSADYTVRLGSEWRLDGRLSRRIADERPDLLVLDSVRQLDRLAQSGFRPDTPTALLIHESPRAERVPPFLDRIEVISNSPQTAERVRRHYGVESPVVPPIIRREHLRPPRRKPRFATLVSPHPKKGLDLVLKVAEALPSIPFMLLEGWPMTRTERRALRHRIRPLGNVELRPSTPDVWRPLAETRLLLAPSRVPETFGRIALEANLCGVPAFVTDIGALPWVVGEGGRVFDLDAGAEAWASEIERTFDDEGYYRSLSEAARRNAERPAFDPERILDRFEAVARRVIEEHAGGRRRT